MAKTIAEYIAQRSVTPENIGERTLHFHGTVDKIEADRDVVTAIRVNPEDKVMFGSRYFLDIPHNLLHKQGIPTLELAEGDEIYAKIRSIGTTGRRSRILDLGNVTTGIVYDLSSL